jgi:hypothetical protein
MAAPQTGRKVTAVQSGAEMPAGGHQNAVFLDNKSAVNCRQLFNGFFQFRI